MTERIDVRPVRAAGLTAYVGAHTAYTAVYDAASDTPVGTLAQRKHAAAPWRAFTSSGAAVPPAFTAEKALEALAAAMRKESE